MPLALLSGFLLLPSPATAHGIGGRLDLPVPLEYFLVGAALVLVITFVWLAVYRGQTPEPSLTHAEEYQQPILPRLVPVLGTSLGWLGIAITLWGLGWGFFGPQDSGENPLPVLIWVGLWLIVPFWSALVGNFYQLLSPLRWLYRLGSRNPPLYPERKAQALRLGVWVFLAITWWELVYTQSANPRHLAFATLGYLFCMWLWNALVGGSSTKHPAPDGFGLYNQVLGAMGPIRVETDGKLFWRGWFRGLPTLPASLGSTYLILAIIGTVSYDGLSATSWWQRDIEPWWVEQIGSVMGWSISFSVTVVGTLGLLGAVGVMIGLYFGACWISSRVSSKPWLHIAARFSPSLIPIGFAYAFAHYFTLILFEGQQLLFHLSDPFGLGWNLFGTADWSINYSLISASTVWVWYVQLVVILGGHLVGIWLAHRRAMEDFSPTVAVRSQYGMLGLMVGLTMLGLTILSA